MKIKIVIWTKQKIYSVYADDNANDFSIGEKILNSGASEFASQAISIVKDWPKNLVGKYEESNSIKYKIAYDYGNGGEQISGIDSVPENFYALVDLINRFENPQLDEINKIMGSGR